MIADQRISKEFLLWTTANLLQIVPKTPKVFPKERLVPIEDNATSIKIIINTELAKNMYKAKIKKYKEKLFDYDKKYFRLYATIWLSDKDGPRVHIKVAENFLKIYLILKN